MIPQRPLELPEDHAQLLQGAAELHPEHQFRHHASDAVVLQDPTTKQFLHVTHEKIRQHQGRLSKTTTNAGLASENAELRIRLARLEAMVAAVSPEPAKAHEDAQA